MPTLQEELHPYCLKASDGWLARPLLCTRPMPGSDFPWHKYCCCQLARWGSTTPRKVTRHWHICSPSRKSATFSGPFIPHRILLGSTSFVHNPMGSIGGKCTQIWWMGKLIFLGFQHHPHFFIAWPLALFFENYVITGKNKNTSAEAIITHNHVVIIGNESVEKKV